MKWYIIIPLYNSDYIEKQLLSIKSLEMKEGELHIIFIDDGSDEEYQIEYKKIFKKYHYLHIEYYELGEKNGKNRVCLARNKGTEFARGENLIFLDQETLPPPDYLEKLKKYYETKDVILGPYFGYNNLEKRLEEEDIQFFLHNGTLQKENFGDFRIDFYKEKNVQKRIWEFFCASNLYIKKEVFNAVGGFDETRESWGDEDIEFGYRLFRAGYKIIFDETLGVLNVSKKLYMPPFKILEESKVFSLSENWYKNYKKHTNPEYKRYIYDRFHHLLPDQKKCVAESFRKEFLEKKNVLIHAINGIGLGHIQRTVLIAKELAQSEEIGEIIFVSNSTNTFLITNAGFRVERLECGIEDTLKDISYNFYEQRVSDTLQRLVQENHISIIIHDTHFLQSFVLGRRDLIHFLVLRESELSHLQAIQNSFGFFRKIFIPHIKEEFSYEKQVFFQNLKNVIFTGYITGRPGQKEIHSKKIIVSPGYGGDYEDTKKFFEYVNTLIAHNQKYLDGYTVTFVLGKHYEKLKEGIHFHPRFFLRDFLPDLQTEINDCFLFFGRGGYNTLNELIINRIKSLLFPVKRFAENQEARIDFFIEHFHLEHIKKGEYILENDTESLHKLLSDATSVGVDISYFGGATNVVKEMKKELMKKNILIFKHIFLPQSEHFIFEELSAFENINPIIVTLKEENKEVFAHSFELNYNKCFDDLLILEYPQVENKKLYIEFLKYIVFITKKNNIKVIYTEFLFDAYFIHYVKNLDPNIKIISAGRGYDAYTFLRKNIRNPQVFLKSVNQILSRDENMKELMISYGIPKEKLDTVRSVVDTEKYEFVEKNFDVLDVLIGGRFVEKKNLLDLLDLIFLLKNENLLGKVGLVGDGPLAQDIVGKIEGLGLRDYIKVYGFLEHQSLLKCLKEYNCFINYSKEAMNGDNEGIPNLIVENILVGNMVFSTITGGIGELFDDKSINALSGNRDTDKEKIKKLITQKEIDSHIIYEDFIRIQSLFDKKNSICKLETILLRYYDESNHRKLHTL